MHGMHELPLFAGLSVCVEIVQSETRWMLV
jgi:hypothetical protein